MKTDEIIQQKLRSLFKNCTLLTIAHRLDTIIDADHIIVMDSGRCVESGSPLDLLAVDHEDSTITRSSRFAQMVLDTGSHAQVLFDSAKKSHLRN